MTACQTPDPDLNRILIGQDGPLVARFLVRGLQSQGYQTAQAADGSLALEMALSGQFDLLLLDLDVPGLDGLDVLAQLRRQRSRIPVIALSARSAAADIVAALDGGADDYLTKPFPFAELVARIRAQLRSAGAEGNAGRPLASGEQ